jgi:hypothetical protein
MYEVCSVQKSAAGPRQHSSSRFREPSGPMTIFRSVYVCTCFEMEPPLRGEEGSDHFRSLHHYQGVAASWRRVPAIEYQLQHPPVEAE